MELDLVVRILGNYPVLRSQLTLTTTIQYVDLICLLKPDISHLHASYQSGPPEHLPVNIHEFLITSLGITDDIGKLAWTAFNHIAWAHEKSVMCNSIKRADVKSEYVRMFLEHGLCRGLGMCIQILPLQR